LPEQDWAEVTAVLSEPERALFARFSFSDQWHSYRVFCTLRAAGYTQLELLKAALLHDIGKTEMPLTIWERTMIVVLGRLMPRRTAEWGKESGRLEIGRLGNWWRRPFVVKRQHPEWGAAMAELAGSRPPVVSLIRRHQDALPEPLTSTEDQLLACLQWADDQN
jgi:putative nucleotidyltransferase with HDIG domain